MQIAVSGESTKMLSCDALSKNGTGHSVEIQVSGNEVVDLTYTSTNQRGYECGIRVSRYETRRWEKSEWKCNNGDCLIALYAFDFKKEHAIIRLTNAQGFFVIRVISAEPSICGASGYIAGEVILDPSSSTCELHEEVRPVLR